MANTNKKSKSVYREDCFLDSLIISTVLSGLLFLISKTGEEKIRWVSPILFLLLSYIAYCVCRENSLDEDSIVYEKKDYFKILVQVGVIGIALGSFGSFTKDKAIEIIALILLPVSVAYPILKLKVYDETKYSPFKPTLNHMVLWVTFIYTKNINVNLLLGILSVIFETKKVSLKETERIKPVGQTLYFTSLVMAVISLLYQAGRNVKVCFFVIIGTAAGILCTKLFKDRVVQIAVGVGVASFLVLIAYL